MYWYLNIFSEYIINSSKTTTTSIHTLQSHHLPNGSINLVLTGNTAGVGVLVRVFHVLHQGLSSKEHLVTERTRGGVWSADQSRVLLQPTNTLLTETHTDHLVTLLNCQLMHVCLLSTARSLGFIQGSKFGMRNVNYRTSNKWRLLCLFHWDFRWDTEGWLVVSSSVRYESYIPGYSKQ